MSQVSSGLKSINELLDYQFIIPSYQRGYRWKAHQVRDLLNDILEFYNKEKSKNEFYCLQPIVISPDASNGKVQVIDGQQRLTTIHIILSHLEDILKLLGKTRFTIEYQTRPNSEVFLNSIDAAKKDDNIDYYHMVLALETIKDWFDQKDGTLKLQFLNTLLANEGNNVRVIWYELDGNENPIQVFTRLNMGKIGLNNAELIKALLLSSAHKITPEEKKDFQHRQREIASEWDAFESQLRQEDFWGFLQNGVNDYDNHIEFIFDLIANNLAKDGRRKDKDKYFTFRYFSERVNSFKDAVEQWNHIKQVFQLLHDWYSDRRLYHLVGFLISAGEHINDLIELGKSSTKSAFFESLRSLIKKHVSENISTLTYQDDKKELRRTLLLFNVLSILDNPKSNIRFQFGRYKAESWDIEHITSVASEMPISNAHQLDWLREVEKFTQDEKLKTKISKYLKTPAKERTTTFEKLYTSVLKLYKESSKKEINDISNLTLLDSGTNRGYKNAVFPIKRKVIIEKDRFGHFIPMCTKNVFLKYYNDNVGQMTFWGDKDRETYKAALTGTIQAYFNGKNYEK